MRVISMSGGLEFGPPSGPWLDVVPMPTRPGRPIGVAEAIAATKGPLEWHSWAQMVRNAPPGTLSPQIRRMRGVSGVSQSLHVRFLRARDQNPLDALYTIEEHEAEGGGSLPPALAGAALAAAQARRLPTLAPMIIARACDMQPPSEATRWNRQQIEQLVDSFVRSLIQDGAGDVLIPGGGVDRARFWLAIGQRLWNAQERPRIVRAEPSLESRLTSGAMAAAWLELRAVESVEVAGVRLYVTEEAAPEAWAQTMEWERGGIGADALRYLSSNEMPTGEPTINRVLLPGDPAPTNEDLALCHGLATALLREASEQGVYAPNGAFVLALPADYPLRAWGVDALRVWAHPAGLWAAVVDDEGRTGASFGWRPGEALSRWVVSEQAEPLLTTTLAALWRDLRVAGEDAVPEQHRERREIGRRPTRRAARRATGGRTLPGGPGRLRGRRQWGSDVEREAIQRRAHGVRGHLRRLRRGWRAGEQARGLAVEFGIALPDGFTFVRPHVRGGEGDVEKPAEVVVRSRGLATVMALL